MSERAILWPVVALVALTFVVSVVMYRRRIGEMRAKRIHPQQVATATMMATRLENVGAADNFRNLFEAPVLFYVAALVALVLHATSAPLVALAWTYVALRVIHSVIHCTTNRVRYRFAAYAASHAVLLAIWIVVAWSIAAGA
ncbi:MAG: MAPEG family protein [Betaproteobacteria bacterium]